MGAALTLAGCVTRPGLPPTPVGASGALPTAGATPGAAPGIARTLNPAPEAIAYRGRFAVRYMDSNGEERHAYGNFQWNESGDIVRLELQGPLGQTLAIVDAAPASATLELPNREPRTAANVEQLMRTALGFSLPVDGLPYWLLARPAPHGHAHAARDASGRLTRLRQDGWTIDFLAYAPSPASSGSPRVKRLDLSRDDPPLSVKLALDD